MSIKYHSLDFAFAKLMESWYDMPRSFRDKYATYRSKHFNAEIGIGIGKKIEMLEASGFRGVWYKTEDKGGIL